MKRAQPRMKRAIQLLIAEDSDDDARMVVRVLERAGFKVQYDIVANAAAMRAALDRQAWDAVVSDFQIPDFGGMEALSLVQGRRLDIPFILISGAVGEEIAVEALKAGVNDYVLKKNLQRLPAVLERELRESEVRGGLRRAEAALRESEERLRTIVESEPECVKLVSREGKLLEMNAAGLAMLEADSLAAARARPLLDFIVPEHREAFAALHQRVIRGASGTLEFEVVGLKGGRRWLETHAAPLAAAGGKGPMLLGVTRDVTERKRAEEELRRFKLAMDASADVIFIVDRATMRHVELNETACRLLGYTRAELLKMGPQDILPVGRAELERTYDALIADPSQAGGLESYYRCKDGSQLPFESTRRVLRSGERWLVVAVSRDIRRRRAAQAALRESEERYRAIFEQAAVGITHTDLEGRFLMVNPKICEITGYSREEMLQRTIRDVTHPDDLRDGDALRQRLIAGDDARLEREARALRKGGGHIWINITSSVVRGADGSPAHLVSIVHDITERKRAEQELQRFSLAMDVSADSIYLTDPAEMRFVYLNATACQRLGYSREQLLQMGPQDVLPIGREQIAREYAEVVAAGEKGLIHERAFVRADGSRGWTELHRRALQTGGGTLIITIGRDISERKNAEERVIRLNRIYVVLSSVNGAIVRIRERAGLFSEICRIAVAEGGYLVARLVEMDANGRADLAATTETDSSYQQSIVAEYNADPGRCQNFLARALRSGEAQISNDVRNDVRIPRRAQLTKDGNYALALLPFKVEGRVAGALMLRAAAVGAFDAEEMRLLRELVGNLSFALELMDKQQRLDHLAFYDALTGLANRSLLIERLGQSIRAAAPAHGKLAIVLADLERLRTVNESLGRQAGDALLRDVAQRLAAAAGHGEVARIGIDNFAVVLQGVKGKSEVTRRIERLWQDCFGKPFRLGDAEFRAAARAGIALYPNDGTDAETLLGNAEAALRRAKQTGERHVFHALEMTATTGEKLTLETSLRQALEKDEFVLHYQPKVDLVTRRIVAVEALIRWLNPTLGLVPPGQFIPLMEETGLILQVGAWALARAVDDHARWRALGLATPRVAVNVSAIQLRRRDFVATVEKALAGGGSPPGLDVEITESLAMQDVEGNVEKLKALRALGLSIAIDDFGTGYSSLGYLAKLPIQALKIDRSFIVTMLTDPHTMTLVSTIISLAHSLRLKVVAEGVENEDQAKVLRLLRCDEMQGYLFSKPVPFDQLTELLRKEETPSTVA
jgi:PAS domain S-box-containing protein/diguanylate cyclase (GGDEF)-like protein